MDGLGGGSSDHTGLKWTCSTEVTAVCCRPEQEILAAWVARKSGGRTKHCGHPAWANTTSGSRGAPRSSFGEIHRLFRGDEQSPDRHSQVVAAVDRGVRGIERSSSDDQAGKGPVIRTLDLVVDRVEKWFEGWRGLCSVRMRSEFRVPLESVKV